MKRKTKTIRLRTGETRQQKVMCCVFRSRQFFYLLIPIKAIKQIYLQQIILEVLK